MALRRCEECGREISTDAKVCPHCGKRRPTGNPTHRGLYKILFVVLVIGLIGSLGKLVGIGGESSTGQEQGAAPVGPPVFDIPSLLGKNIDEVRVALGPPADERLREPPDRSRAMDFSQWDNRFEKNGYKLLVEFDPKSRKVIDFFFPTNDPSQKTSDYEQLMRLTNVSNSDSMYSVEAVRVEGSPSEYTGIVISPRNR